MTHGVLQSVYFDHLPYNNHSTADGPPPITQPMNAGAGSNFHTPEQNESEI